MSKGRRRSFGILGSALVVVLRALVQQDGSPANPRNDKRQDNEGKYLRSCHVLNSVRTLLAPMWSTIGGISHAVAPMNMTGRVTVAPLKHLFADGAYDRTRLMNAAACRDFVLEIVRRTDKESGFKVLPKRWTVESTFGWMTRRKRLVRATNSASTSPKP